MRLTRLRGLSALAVTISFGVSVAYCTPTPLPQPAVPTATTTTAPPPRPPGPGLTGFVDLHTHPLANVGFAGKLVYGGVDAAPDGGALLPADPGCHEDVPATSVEQALGHDESTHGSWGLQIDPSDILEGHLIGNSCGDLVREQIVSAVQQANDANNPP